MAENQAEGTDLAHPRRRARRRWARRLGCVLLMFLLAGGLYFAVLRHQWRAEFHRRVEAIRAAGFPVTGKDLDAWCPWPQSGENAAHWITGAATLRKRADPEQAKALETLISRRGGDRLRPADPLPADLKALLERHLQDNAKALQSLHEAAAIPECRYPVDFSTIPNVVMPYLSDVQDGCRLLCLEAVLLAEKRDADGAIKATEAIVRVTRSLEKEPMMISHLVELAGAYRATVALERILNQVTLTREQVTRLQEAFRGIHVEEGLVRAMAGVQCLLVALFEKPQALNREAFNGLPPVPFLEAYHALGFSAREGVLALDYVDECIRISQRPASERSAALAAAERHFRTRKGLLLHEAGYTANQIRRTAQQTVALDLAVTALAVEQYRLAQASLPATLDQLVPGYLAAIPEDPFDGKPLRYQRLDRGFVLYSIGEDGRDDGGAEEPPKEMRKSGETYDVVFRVERSAVATP